MEDVLTEEIFKSVSSVILFSVILAASVLVLCILGRCIAMFVSVCMFVTEYSFYQTVRYRRKHKNMKKKKVEEV